MKDILREHLTKKHLSMVYLEDGDTYSDTEGCNLVLLTEKGLDDDTEKLYRREEMGSVKSTISIQRLLKRNITLQLENERLHNELSGEE